jgi:hypothetical protein
MRRTAAIVAASVLLFAGCGQDDGAWTQEVRNNFMDGCLEASGGQQEYCSCVLDALEETYTLEEFDEIERQLDDTGVMPPEVESMIEACIDEHLT